MAAQATTMTRLQQALQRLYLSPDPPDPPDPADAGAAGPASLISADGLVRAMVLSLGGPADWQALATVWQGVQVDLALPAPAIAVSGHDAFQLWFSLATAVPANVAAAFLAALQQRYLADVKPQRIRLAPTADGHWPLGAVPAQQLDAEHWSAFVSADLAPMFADTPWLDTPPNPDGQAGVLAALQPITPDAFEQALRHCGITADSAVLPDIVPIDPPSAAVTGAPAGVQHDPRRFLLDVMNDARVPLALRIEAAKALLPHGLTG